jgi:uncharacterized membrane protein
MISPFFHILLSFIGVLGFSLCAYLYKCKHKKQPLVCPLRGSCDFVTTSKYSKFLGIHLEILGMIYYGMVTALHLMMVFIPSLANHYETLLGLSASTFAFIFSLYLTGIQAFVLKQWCTWCLCSATLCLLIFVTTYISAPAGVFAGIF